eukprot:5932162-Pyramimonas_sp.AAC.1
MWYEPPGFSVDDPDVRASKMGWMSERIYRVAIEFTKDFRWTEIDGEAADDGAMRTHLEEVERCRASLLREANQLKAHREMLGLVFRDIYQHRTDVPLVSTDAHAIEACVQYLQQSEAKAFRRGLRLTPDTFQRAAVE